jgi:hypothetical protein
MQVIAKFKCDSIELTPQTSTIKLTPVINGSKENEKFWKYTPAGAISLSTTAKEAAAIFEPGLEYFVTFERAK